MHLKEARAILRELATNTELSVAEQHMRTAGVITAYVEEKIGVKLIVVGGLSVEMYTEGDYMTEDIDFVGPNHEAIMACLKDLGYVKLEETNKNLLGGAAMRYHEELKSLVEIPSSRLKDADYDRVMTVKTKDGLPIHVIGVEDIIADRIRATVNDKTDVHRQHIADMLTMNDVDLNYLTSTLTADENALLTTFLVSIQNPHSEMGQLERLRTTLRTSGTKLNGIYSDLGDLILFSIGKNQYIGMTTLPYLMVYVYDADEDAIEPLYKDDEKIEMTLEEVIDWFMNPEHTNGIDFYEFTVMLKEVITTIN